MNRIIFRQMLDRVSCTYTYLLADLSSRQAILIDPVLEHVQRDLTVVKELDLHLKYVANTHVHADHITGTGELKKRLLSLSNGNPPLSVISKASGARADVLVSEGDVISVGSEIKLKVVSTPGHTNGCVTYIDESNAMAFTGDALLIRGCGRTDFQEGNASLLYDSVWNKIFSLPDFFQLYPAHDYKGLQVTTVGEEKKYNPRLTKTKEEFIEIMHNLNLDYPKMIDKAVPANLVCGLQDD